MQRPTFATFAVVRAAVRAAAWRPPSRRLLATRSAVQPAPLPAVAAADTAAAAAAVPDHRTICKSQDIYFTHPWSPGCAIFLPHGLRIMTALKQQLRKILLSRHAVYHELDTPLIYHSDLWRTSGHWQAYAHNMYRLDATRGIEVSPREDLHGSCDPCDQESDKDINKSSDNTPHSNDQNNNRAKILPQYAVKPMNCPAHCLAFAARPRWESDLPLRFLDFSALHRNESADTYTGLTRLREFHQDDAHIFCSPPQVLSEVRCLLMMVQVLYANVFGFTDFEYRLATRGEGAIGDDSEWHDAEHSLRSALEQCVGPENEINGYSVAVGDGAFYGPKIDVYVKDAHRRSHQLATIQLDLQLPKRFALRYESRHPKEARPDHLAEAGTVHRVPILVHRALLGSFERLLGIVAEHCEGSWPFFMSPRQVALVPVESGPHEELALRLCDRLYEECGLHVEVLPADGSPVSARVWQARARRTNYTVVIGQREIESGRYCVRATWANKQEDNYLAKSKFGSKSQEVLRVLRDEDQLLSFFKTLQNMPFDLINNSVFLKEKQ